MLTARQSDDPSRPWVPRRAVKIGGVLMLCAAFHPRCGAASPIVVLPPHFCRLVWEQLQQYYGCRTEVIDPADFSRSLFFRVPNVRAVTVRDCVGPWQMAITHSLPRDRGNPIRWTTGKFTFSADPFDMTIDYKGWTINFDPGDTGSILGITAFLKCDMGTEYVKTIKLAREAPHALPFIRQFDSGGEHRQIPNIFAHLVDELVGFLLPYVLENRANEELIAQLLRALYLVEVPKFWAQCVRFPPPPAAEALRQAGVIMTNWRKLGDERWKPTLRT